MISTVLIITDIKPHSPADVAGLKVGDHVIAVNRESVIDMSAENVGRVIRYYTHRVVVEVLRC